MSDDMNDRVEDAAMDAALDERLGGAKPPDVSDGVRAGIIHCHEPPRPYASWLLTAAVCIIATTIVIAIAVLTYGNGTRQEAAQRPMQDPVKVIDATSAGQIEALPPDTKAIRGTGIEDDEIPALLRLTQLEWLELRGVLISPFRHPNKVEPMQTITDDGLLHLASLQNLKTLILRAQSRVGPKGLAILSRLRKLEHLEFHNMALSDGALAVLSEMRQLRTLKFEGVSGFGAATTRRIFELKNLRELSFQMCTYLDPEWLTGIGKLRRLEKLNLGWAGMAAYSTITPPPPQPVRDEIFDEIVKLKHLRDLSLAASFVTGAGLARMAAIPLARLDLSNCQGVDADAVPVLLRFENLEKLVVHECRNLGWAELKQLRALPKLKEFLGDTEQLKK